MYDFLTPVKACVAVKQIAILLFGIVLTLGISYGMHANTIAIFAKSDMGATYDDLASIGLAKFVPYVLIPFFIGVILSRANNAYIIIAGVAMHAIPLFMISTAETIVEIILYQFAVGAAHAFIWPPTNSIFSGQPKTRVKNITRAVMFFLVGMMIGPLVGAAILETTENDYRLLFQVSAIVMATSTVLVVLLRTRLSPPKKSAPLDLKSFGTILHFPVVVALVLFTTAISGILIVIYPAFLTDKGIEVSAILLLYFAYGVGRVGSMLLVGHLNKWLGHVLTLCIALTTAGLAVSLFGTSFGHFAIALVLLSFGILAYPICLEMILARTRRSLANKMVGAYAALVGLGWFLGPLIAGFTAHRFGEDAPYWIFLAAGVVLTGAAATLHKSLAAVESRYKQAVDANHSLKHDFSIILMNAGLMNMELAKAKVYEDVLPAIRRQYGDLAKIFVKVEDTLVRTSNMADPTLADDIRSLVSRIKDVDVASGVGRGYPGYGEIKEGIDDCIERLDEAVTVDVMLDIRHWVSNHMHHTKRPYKPSPPPRYRDGIRMI